MGLWGRSGVPIGVKGAGLSCSAFGIERAQTAYECEPQTEPRLSLVDEGEHPSISLMRKIRHEL